MKNRSFLEYFHSTTESRDHKEQIPSHFRWSNCDYCPLIIPADGMVLSWINHYSKVSWDHPIRFLKTSTTFSSNLDKLPSSKVTIIYNPPSSFPSRKWILIRREELQIHLHKNLKHHPTYFSPLISGSSSTYFRTFSKQDGQRKQLDLCPFGPDGKHCFDKRTLILDQNFKIKVQRIGKTTLLTNSVEGPNWSKIEVQAHSKCYASLALLVQ